MDTGFNSMTGGRIKRIENHILGERFMTTYCDGLSNVDMNKLLEFHEKIDKYATLTAVQPEGKFGALNMDSKNNILEFKEKPNGDQNWITRGFFVLKSDIFDYIQGDNISFERESLENLASDNQLSAYKHNGFWKPHDQLIDKKELKELWQSKNSPWKLWND